MQGAYEQLEGEYSVTRQQAQLLQELMVPMQVALMVPPPPMAAPDSRVSSKLALVADTLQRCAEAADGLAADRSQLQTRLVGASPAVLAPAPPPPPPLPPQCVFLRLSCDRSWQLSASLPPPHRTGLLFEAARQADGDGRGVIPSSGRAGGERH